MKSSFSPVSAWQPYVTPCCGTELEPLKSPDVTRIVMDDELKAAGKEAFRNTIILTVGGCPKCDLAICLLEVDMLQADDPEDKHTNEELFAGQTSVTKFYEGYHGKNLWHICTYDTARAIAFRHLCGPFLSSSKGNEAMCRELVMSLWDNFLSINERIVHRRGLRDDQSLIWVHPSMDGGEGDEAERLIITPRHEDEGVTSPCCGAEFAGFPKLAEQRLDTTNAIDPAAQIHSSGNFAVVTRTHRCPHCEGLVMMAEVRKHENTTGLEGQESYDENGNLRYAAQKGPARKFSVEFGDKLWQVTAFATWSGVAFTHQLGPVVLHGDAGFVLKSVVIPFWRDLYIAGLFIVDMVTPVDADTRLPTIDAVTIPRYATEVEVEETPSPYRVPVASILNWFRRSKS